MKDEHQRAAPINDARGTLHTREQFCFMVRAPLALAWPLFGAQGERAWAIGWDPKFIWPRDACDQEGMVFTVAGQDWAAVWVNTAFDPTRNRIQYVYFVAEIMITIVTLLLMPLGEATRVDVSYQRTALREAANAVVRTMAESDKLAGDEWRRQIDTFLSDAAALR